MNDKIKDNREQIEEKINSIRMDVLSYLIHYILDDINKQREIEAKETGKPPDYIALSAKERTELWNKLKERVYRKYENELWSLIEQRVKETKND